MRNRIKFVILVVLLCMMVYPTGLRAPSQVDAQSTQDFEIGIISSLSPEVLENVLMAFNSSDFAINNNFHYPQNISFQSPTDFDAYKAFIETDNYDADLIWGAPQRATGQLISSNLLKPMTNTSFLTWLETNIPTTIGGVDTKQYNADNLMAVANNMISNGIMINNNSLAENNLEFPQSYTDLGSPEYFSWTNPHISIADPTSSYTGYLVYASILQELGWDLGWQVIYQIAGNSQIFDGSLTSIYPTITGESRFSLTNSYLFLDNYEQNSALDFTVPTSSNSILLNSLALPADIESTEEVYANELMKFILSAEGQSLSFNQSSPHLPIRSDALDYAKTNFLTEEGYSEEYVNRISSVYNQISSKNVEILNETYFYEDLLESMRYHFSATTIDAYDQLRNAWSGISDASNNDAINSTEYETLLENFGEPEIDEQTAQEINEQLSTDSTFRTSKVDEWTSSAQSKYNKIITDIDIYSNNDATSSSSIQESTSNEQNSENSPELEASTGFLWFSSVIVFTTAVVYRRQVKV